MRDLEFRGFIVENGEIFSSYVKFFLIFPRERNRRILIGLYKKRFMNHPTMFLDRDNKMSVYVSASFFTFYNSYGRKVSFNL